MMDPRKIATLGIGYGGILIARLGLWTLVTGNYITFSRRRGRR